MAESRDGFEHLEQLQQRNGKQFQNFKTLSRFLDKKAREKGIPIFGQFELMVDPLEANDLYTLLHDHDCALKNRYAGRLTVTGHIALENAIWFAGDGETTEMIKDGEIRDLPEKGILCIDTGCGKGGRLTAMIVEDRRFMLQSIAED